jgi:hypothetical protein
MKHHEDDFLHYYKSSCPSCLSHFPDITSVIDHITLKHLTPQPSMHPIHHYTADQQSPRTDEHDDDDDDQDDGDGEDFDDVEEDEEDAGDDDDDGMDDELYAAIDDSIAPSSTSSSSSSSTSSSSSSSSSSSPSSSSIPNAPPICDVNEMPRFDGVATAIDRISGMCPADVEFLYLWLYHGGTHAFYEAIRKSQHGLRGLSSLPLCLRTLMNRVCIALCCRAM